MEEYTKYEEARIIGARALQISQGAPFMIKLNDEDLQKIGYNTVEIAKMEFKKGLIPMVVKRPLPGAVKKIAVSAKPFDQTKME
ncbi:DNA-directed RNA polymerase subunit K [Candidatus Woesearchaeota archaeon]|nr:DNA-directed RNA polymerase subunit K [Candidatus Woesearchaeota archaeon]